MEEGLSPAPVNRRRRIVAAVALLAAAAASIATTKVEDPVATRTETHTVVLDGARRSVTLMVEVKLSDITVTSADRAGELSAHLQIDPTGADASASEAGVRVTLPRDFAISRETDRSDRRQLDAGADTQVILASPRYDLEKGPAFRGCTGTCFETFSIGVELVGEAPARVNLSVTASWRVERSPPSPMFTITFKEAAP